MFLVVPQWQGSGSSRSMRLVDGAHAIMGDLPTGSTKTVEIPLEAGDERGSGVARCSSLLLVRDRMLEELGLAGEPVITVGGDCGVELAAIQHVIDQDVAVVWFDAHPDLNSPASSGTGAFHGMVLRTLLGDGADSLVPPNVLSPDRIILAGARAFDQAEDEFVTTSGIRTIEVDDLTPDSVLEAIVHTGASSVYLHIDLDVLDPGDFHGLGFPEPFGLTGTSLAELIRAIKARFPLAGAGLTEFAPTSMDEAVNDMPTILRIIAALTA